MGWLIKFIKSSIGAKLVVAFTGVALFLFVLQHMIANWAIFAGQDAMNSYAAWIKSKTLIVWGGRIGLLGAAVVHIYMTLRLTRMNQVARPEKYGKYKNKSRSLSSNFMALSGLTVLAFIIFHLLHFTLGQTHPEHFALMETMADGSTRHDVYSMFVLGFQDIPVAVSYIVAMLLLGVHLNHGVSSLFQTLGISHPQWDPLIKMAGPAFAIFVSLGNIAMPVAVLLGHITLPGA